MSMSYNTIHIHNHKKLDQSECKNREKNISILTHRKADLPTPLYPTINYNNKTKASSLNKIIHLNNLPKVTSSSKKRKYLKRNPRNFFNSRKIIDDMSKTDDTGIQTPNKHYKNRFYITDTLFNVNRSTKKNGVGLYTSRKTLNTSENEKKNKLLSCTPTFDYDLVMKRLDKWDKDHCEKNPENIITLYNKLNKYYIDNNLLDDQKNLNTTNTIMKSRNTFNKIIETVSNKNLKVISNLLYSNKKKEFRSELYQNMPNNFLNPKTYITELSKTAVKYENQSYKDLIFVNNIILNKKGIKLEKSEEFNKICEKQNNLRLEYNEKYVDKMKLYEMKLDEYDHHYKKIRHTQELIEKNKEPIKEERGRSKKSPGRERRYSRILNDMEFAKNNEVYSMNNKLKVNSSYNNEYNIFYYVLFYI